MFFYNTYILIIFSQYDLNLILTQNIKVMTIDDDFFLEKMVLVAVRTNLRIHSLEISYQMLILYFVPF